MGYWLQVYDEETQKKTRTYGAKVLLLPPPPLPDVGPSVPLLPTRLPPAPPGWSPDPED